MKTIEKYKGIDIKYRVEDGRLVFNFEGIEREVKYLFEAKQVIDEPRWEPCEEEGYWLDGVMKEYIGVAKAERKDIKSGRPDWKLKGQYDSDYKSSGLGWRANEERVYPRTKERDEIYRDWKKQREIVLAEEQKMKVIIRKL